jgi:hypothetical protein
MRPVIASDPVPEVYRWFAEHEAGSSSPSYARLARAVAGSSELVGLLAGLEPGHRQPNLLFAALRRLGVDVTDPDLAVTWARAHWPSVRALVTTRRTQTNEPARCAAMVAALSQLPSPIALVELGASAGLCLIPDAWDYAFSGAAAVELRHRLGPGGLTIGCTVHAAAPPLLRLPQISWRAGLDLNPLPPADPETAAWLQCLVWPEHRDRAARLAAALDVAARLRPPVRSGDMVTETARLLADVPADLTVVVAHSAALAYLDSRARQQVIEVIAAAGAHRLGQEGSRVLPHLAVQLPQDEVALAGRLVLSLDDTVLGFSAPHGGDVWWRG